MDWASFLIRDLIHGSPPVSSFVLTRCRQRDSFFQSHSCLSSAGIVVWTKPRMGNKIPESDMSRSVIRRSSILH
jgi:hypothetical protein